MKYMKLYKTSSPFSHSQSLFANSKTAIKLSYLALTESSFFCKRDNYLGNLRKVFIGKSVLIKEV